MKKLLAAIGLIVLGASPALADAFSDQYTGMVGRIPLVTIPKNSDYLSMVRNGIPYKVPLALAPGTRASILAMPVVNARDPTYAGGMQCDGSTDDAPALQAAVTAAVTAGNSVFIMANQTTGDTICMIGSGVSLPSNTTLWATPNTVTLKMRTGNTTGLTGVASGSHVLVYGLTFDGGGQDFASAQNVNTLFIADDVVYDTVRFQNTRGIAFLASTSVTNSGVRNSVFVNIGNHWKTTSSAADRQQALAFCCGLRENNYGNFSINNVFTDVGLDPISFGDQKDFRAEQNKCYIFNNQLSLLSTSAYAACIFSTDNDSAIIVGNMSDGASGNGIDIPDTKNATVVGNISNGSGDCGIGIFGNTNATVSGNITKNNAQWSSAAASNGGGGICVNNVGDGGRSTISGNVSTDDQALVSTTCSGTVGIGATSCTLAAITNIEVGGKIKIAGAGVAAADLSTRVTAVSGTTGISWFDATSTSTSGAAVTGVATQLYGVYGKAASTYTDLNIGYENILSGNVTGAANSTIIPYMPIVTTSTDLQFRTTGGVQFEISNVASAVNRLLAVGSAAGQPSQLRAFGTDTDIDIGLYPKGAGDVRISPAAATQGLTILSTGTNRAFLHTNTAALALNPLVSSGDISQIWAGSTADNSNAGSFVLAPWSATARGLKMDYQGNTTINGVVSTAGGGLQIGSPSGGDKGADSLNVKGTVWSDGTQGIASCTVVTAAATITIKNGLITAFTGC